MAIASSVGVPLLAVVCALGGPAVAGSFEPAPRDEKGRFTNPNGPIGHAGLGVRLPFYLRRVGGSFRQRPGAPERVPDAGKLLKMHSGSAATVTWVGHATLLVQMDGVAFLTDPIWSDTPSPLAFAGPRRFVPPGVQIDDLPEIDFVLVSHNHYDHLDLPTLVALAERGDTRFLVPLENSELLRDAGIQNVSELDWGQQLEIGDVTIHCLPAQHWSRRGLGDERAALWASWAVMGASRSLYFGGDSGFFSGYARIGDVLGPFDLAALPIGAYEPTAMMRESHLNPEEAVRAALELGARRMLGMHFGTFDLSDEPLDEPPRRFLEGARAAGRSEDAWVLRIGETREF